MHTAATPAFVPDWHLPAGVHALQTERGQGPAPYGGFNLGDHVGDDIVQVTAHRQQLVHTMGAIPVWMRQVHGAHVLTLSDAGVLMPEADAALTCAPGIACAVLTADCLPVLIADRQARIVGAAHAGWRGLATGVVQHLVTHMCQTPGVRPDTLTAWLGPAIGPDAFEVGQDVVDAFVARDLVHRSCFKAHPENSGKYLADLAGLAVHVLQRSGVKELTRSDLCTVSLADRFYSYRRDHTTGRMASLIWLG